MYTGAGHKPALDLSFQQHDFGACLVKQPGMQSTQKILHLKNNDTSDLSFDIEWVAQSLLLLCSLTAPLQAALCCIHAKKRSQSTTPSLSLAGDVHNMSPVCKTVASQLIHMNGDKCCDSMH